MIMRRVALPQLWRKKRCDLWPSQKSLLMSIWWLNQSHYTCSSLKSTQNANQPCPTHYKMMLAQQTQLFSVFCQNNYTICNKHHPRTTFNLNNFSYRRFKRSKEFLCSRKLWLSICPAPNTSNHIASLTTNLSATEKREEQCPTNNCKSRTKHFHLESWTTRKFLTCDINSL